MSRDHQGANVRYYSEKVPQTVPTTNDYRSLKRKKVVSFEAPWQSNGAVNANQFDCSKYFWLVEKAPGLKWNKESTTLIVKLKCE